MHINHITKGAVMAIKIQTRLWGIKLMKSRKNGYLIFLIQTCFAAYFNNYIILLHILQHTLNNVHIKILNPSGISFYVGPFFITLTVTNPGNTPLKNVTEELVCHDPRLVAVFVMKSKYTFYFFSFCFIMLMGCVTQNTPELGDFAGKISRQKGLIINVIQCFF
jgi:hypothetical protein